MASDTNTKSKSRTRSKQKVEKQYKVLLHNDNKTTMEFVVCLLMSVFEQPEKMAEAIMMAIHTSGVGIAGVYDKNVANDKATKTMELARHEGYPLVCSVEPE